MAISPLYIPAFSIEDVILDKDTGAPLAGGQVYFEEDNQRGILKPVYQITGTSPDYTYTQLPNPMTLSSIGTFEDSLGNPVVPYFYPYDANGDVDLYYIIVTSAGGVPQFDREAVPYVAAQGSTEILSVITNELSNPQFAQVLFDTNDATYTYNFSGVTNQVVPLAPDWDLIVTCPTTGTVTVSQLTPTGSLNLLSNPGTLLNITSAGLTLLQLRQRIFGSPNLWGLGFISASFIAKTYSGTAVTLNLSYSQSNGTVINQLLVSAILPASGNYEAFPGSVFIPLSTNPDTFPNAYIDIYFDLPLNIQMDITSVMVASTGATSIADISYDQTSYERQVDQLFHYYFPQLSYKPIPSYLVGWDFPLNPCQKFGYLAGLAPVSSGASAAYYLADQTILYQTVNSNFTMTQNFNGLNITANAPSTMAIIQYLSGQQAVEILTQKLAVALKALATTPALIGTVNIYWTNNAAVPVLPLSVVTAVNNATTAPTTTITSGWAAVPRGNLSNAKFVLGTSFQEFMLNGFDARAVAGITAALNVAIVISFNTIAAGQTITLNYCSLNGGDIATRPAPQSFDQVLFQCQHYYEKSYASSVPVGTATAVNQLIRPQTVYPRDNSSSSIARNVVASSFDIEYKNVKRAVPTFTLYSPSSGTGSAVVAIIANGNSPAANSAATASTSWTPNIGTKSACYVRNNGTGLVAVTATDSGLEGYITFQYEADARLGVV